VSHSASLITRVAKTAESAAAGVSDTCAIATSNRAMTWWRDAHAERLTAGPAKPVEARWPYTPDEVTHCLTAYARAGARVNGVWPRAGAASVVQAEYQLR
jgi:hypothetical protein